jgi:hypothetical protein
MAREVIPVDVDRFEYEMIQSTIMTKGGKK